MGISQLYVWGIARAAWSGLGGDLRLPSDLPDPVNRGAAFGIHDDVDREHQREQRLNGIPRHPGLHRRVVEQARYLINGGNNGQNRQNGALNRGFVGHELAQVSARSEREHNRAWRVLVGAEVASKL